MSLSVKNSVTPVPVKTSNTASTVKSGKVAFSGQEGDEISLSSKKSKGKKAFFTGASIGAIGMAAWLILKNPVKAVKEFNWKSVLEHGIKNAEAAAKKLNVKVDEVTMIVKKTADNKIITCFAKTSDVKKLKGTDQPLKLVKKTVFKYQDMAKNIKGMFSKNSNMFLLKNFKMTKSPKK